MILRGWHIDGFGQWHDHRVDDLHHGLNVLHGPNEIGKTTLHAFVRGVLYGFPDGRSRDPAYLPLRGGQHGGRLFLEDESGLLTLARHGRGKGRVSLEDASGGRLDAAQLELRLRGVDGGMFRNVFAFGLDELASLDALQSDEVGLRIFDAGLEGAGRSVAAVVEELDRRKDAELKARSGRIRDLAKALTEARRELDRAVASARGHRALAVAEGDAAAALEARRVEMEAARRRLERWESLLSLWPVELRRRTALAAVEGREDGAESFEARLGALLAEEGLQADRRRRLGVLGRTVEGERRAAAEALGSLGSGWSEERLRALDCSAARRTVVGRHRAAIEAAERRRQEAAGERQRLAAEVARLEAEREEMAAGIVEPGSGRGDPAPAGAGELRRKRVALVELRAAIAAREEAARLVAAGRGAAGLPVRVALGAGAATALVVAATLAWLAIGLPLAAVFALGAGVVVAVFAWLLGRGSAAGRRGGALDLAVEAAELRVAECADILGLDPPITLAAVEAHALDLDDSERSLLHREERLRQLAGFQARLAGSAAALRQAEQELGLREVDAAAALAAWAADSADLGGEFPAGDALALLERAERIVVQLDELAAKEAELAALHEATLAWDDAAAALLDEAGIEVQAPVGLALLGERLGHLRQAREAALQIAEQLGMDARGIDLRAELERGERGHWLEGAAAEREAIGAMEREFATAVEALALQRREREQLERSADVPALGAKVAAIEAAFRGAVGRFREAALLEKLLHQTLERFQQERQPEVLRHAGEAFCRITAGRYVAVRQPVGIKEVEVVDDDGRVVPASALSRGTVEQLYICVRLGLVRAFAARGLRLPLLLDDVFVNFDPARADAAGAVLADFAREHQVLLFTCHPQTVARIEVAAPGCRVVALDPVEGGRVLVA